MNDYYHPALYKVRPAITLTGLLFLPLLAACVGSPSTGVETALLEAHDLAHAIKGEKRRNNMGEKEYLVYRHTPVAEEAEVNATPVALQDATKQTAIEETTAPFSEPASYYEITRNKWRFTASHISTWNDGKPLTASLYGDPKRQELGVHVAFGF